MSSPYCPLNNCIYTSNLQTFVAQSQERMKSLSISKHIYVYFIPTSMFTVTSWVSFLLPPTSYPARTSLLVTVFLCQVGIFTSAIKDTPSSDEGTDTT